MDNIFTMKVAEACAKCGSSALADEIWAHRRPGTDVDRDNGEYKSWRNSTPYFLRAALKAGLGDLDAVFELPTPGGDYIDVTLVGKSRRPAPGETGRLLIVELKQWSHTEELDNKDYVGIFAGNTHPDRRRHPVSQMLEYASQMARNHRGVYQNGHIAVDALTYLHNLPDKNPLISGVYAPWKVYADSVFAQSDEQRLVEYLQETFVNESDPALLAAVDDCGYVMDQAGFEGLLEVVNGRENAVMIKDQMELVDHVRDRIRAQKAHPHPEIIVISGGPGTGKTIVGMHFLADYAQIFNGGKNANGALFCLPMSKAVINMIGHVCRGKVASYLDSYLGHDRRPADLLVVDEAHRIIGLDAKLDQVFAKGTKLVILLQDDHQCIRPGEDGTFAGIVRYAQSRRLPLTALHLTIQKRCASLGKLLEGLDELFYGGDRFDGAPLPAVRVFDRLSQMDAWVERMARESRAKIVAPYCWRWQGGNVTIHDGDELFDKPWNPEAADLAAWYYGIGRADRVASIYTCQGLDFDNVGFIWWNDLVWDEQNDCWQARQTASKDKQLRDVQLPRKELDALFINTYYIMLSRARNKLGIWFRDPATRRHVTQVLGLETYDPAGDDFDRPDETNTVFAVPQTAAKDAAAPPKPRMTGKVTFADHTKKYAYINGDDGENYYVNNKTYERMADPANVLALGTKVSFTVYISKTGKKKYANNIKPA